MGRRRRNARMTQQGTALLVALAVTVVLVSLALAINIKVRHAVDAGQRDVGRAVALQAASGALHAAMALLAEDRRTSRVDSLAETWADADKVSALAAVGAPEGLSLAVRIEDERARIQVNALVDFPRGQQVVPTQQRLWERFLALPAFDDLRQADVTPSMIVSALKDWLDRGDDDAVTGLGGAEKPYYASLPVPYACRNGPLQEVSELRLVRGIGSELIDGKGEISGIGEFLTVFASNEKSGAENAFDGRININTAPMPVLAALLPEEYQDLAQAITEFRQQVIADDMPDLFADPLWYRNAPGCQSLTVEPELITTASDHFRIHAVAEYGGVRTALTAVVERQTDSTSAKTAYRILMWQPS